MSPNDGKESRDAAAGFGRAAEDALAASRRGIDALNSRPPVAPPGKQGNNGDGDINITINR